MGNMDLQNRQNFPMQGMPNQNNNSRFTGNSIYENLNYSNLMLSSWLNSVKNNNNALYDSMVSHSLSDQLMHKSNLERFIQTEQQQKMLELGRLPTQS